MSTNYDTTVVILLFSWLATHFFRFYYTNYRIVQVLTKPIGNLTESPLGVRPCVVDQFLRTLLATPRNPSQGYHCGWISKCTLLCLGFYYFLKLICKTHRNKKTQFIDHIQASDILKPAHLACWNQNFWFFFKIWAFSKRLAYISLHVFIKTRIFSNELM